MAFDSSMLAQAAFDFRQTQRSAWRFGSRLDLIGSSQMTCTASMWLDFRLKSLPVAARRGSEAGRRDIVCATLKKASFVQPARITARLERILGPSETPFA